jgi:hypothetical protein
MNERRFRPTTSTHIQLRVIFEHRDQQAASGGESSQVQHMNDYNIMWNTPNHTCLQKSRDKENLAKLSAS